MTNQSKKRVAILQSSYIPWKGYFDQINQVDYFVLYDCVQYTRRDWRNRNKIKTPHGTHWLTIPVSVKGKFFTPIWDVEVSDNTWAREHFLSIKHHYTSAPFFKNYETELKEIFDEAAGLKLLSDVNHLFLNRICKWLGINTPIKKSQEFQLHEGKSERLLGICQDLNAAVYLSGPAARDYLDTAMFERAGISVEWADYSGYPEYPQVHPPFEHGVSALDLLFHTGAEAGNYMKSFSSKQEKMLSSSK